MNYYDVRAGGRAPKPIFPCALIRTHVALSSALKLPFRSIPTLTLTITLSMRILTESYSNRVTPVLPRVTPVEHENTEVI